MRSHSSDAVDSSLSKGLRWSGGLDPARPSKEGARYALTVRVGEMGTRLLRLLIIRSVLCILITVFCTCAFNHPALWARCGFRLYAGRN